MPDYALKIESIKDAFRQQYFEHLQGTARMAKRTKPGAKKAMGMRPYVGRIIGINSEGHPVKETIKGHKSYDAVKDEGIGQRGVFYHYNLPDKNVYKIHAPISQKKCKKYWAVIVNGKLHEISKEEAIGFASGILKL